jgi:hypothetical protein
MHMCAPCRPWQQLQAALPAGPGARNRELAASVAELWGRRSSDDLLSLFLVLIDAFVVKARPCPA